jgi:hypothetical protein
VNIKIKLSKQDYQKIKNKEQVSPDQAISWVNRCVVGNIKKRDLDNERLNETNSMDMF